MTGPLLALCFVALVVFLLVKKYNAIAVLLLSGMAMLACAGLLGLHLPKLKQATGLQGFDYFQYLIEAFSETNVGVGLVIMVISGFVAYMDKIGASDALVLMSMKPLGYFKNYPYLLASMVLPLGQFLFVSIPSAAGLGLLLMATVFPIMVELGLSRLSAASLITATTAFGIGPASAIALSAADVLDQEITAFFFQYQVPMAVTLSLVLSLSYFFVNRHFDKKLPAEAFGMPIVSNEKKKEQKAPAVYGLLPVLPLILLLVFSDFMGIMPFPVRVDTNIAMILGLFVALLFETIRTRNPMAVLKSLDVFWNGMGDIFKSVVTLIIAADLFAKGLISLGFIDGLIGLSQHLGLGGAGIGVVMTIMIFLASILMGSGNAAFFAFGPLVPGIAGKLAFPGVKIILPMSLAASMGRTVSPIAGVLVAVGELAKVPTEQIVKRNLIPFGLAMALMLILNFILAA